MVLAQTDGLILPKEVTQHWQAKVIELARAWAWAHFARAIQLLDKKEYESAASELTQCVEKDRTATSAYFLLAFIQEKKLGKIDDAISTAERITALPESHPAGLNLLWSVRLTKAQESAEAKARLKEELDQRASSVRDIDTLSAIYSAYSNLLNDKSSALALARKIRQVDSTWYPERGLHFYINSRNESGIPGKLRIANRQAIIWKQTEELNELDAREKIPRLEKLLSVDPSPEMKTYIYRLLFQTAESAGDTTVVVKYGEILRSIDPANTGLLAKIAVALTDQKTNLQNALL